MSYLNLAARGLLEQIIETTITEIPFTVQLHRMEDVQKTWQYKNPDDFVLGYILGRIIYTFETILKMAGRKELTHEELKETMRIIYKRMPEIREAIFKEG